MFKLVKHKNDDRALWACPLCQDNPSSCDECKIGCNEYIWDGYYTSSCVYDCEYCHGSKLLQLQDLLKLVKDVYLTEGIE